MQPVEKVLVQLLALLLERLQDRGGGVVDGLEADSDVVGEAGAVRHQHRAPQRHQLGQDGGAALEQRLHQGEEVEVDHLRQHLGVADKLLRKVVLSSLLRDSGHGEAHSGTMRDPPLRV